MGKPNLFVIGAMKAGTSSLHAALAEHPDIYMSTPKEPAYFVPPQFRPTDVFHNPTDEEACERRYLELFESSAHHKYRGESSTHYTKLPTIQGVAKRIAAFSSNARLIYVVRDPLERALSHYWWNCRFHDEVRSPLQAILHDSTYIDYSNYSMQIKPFFATFSREQVFITTMEEVCSAPDELLSTLFRWLELDPRGTLGRFTNENSTPYSIVQSRSRMIAAFRRSRFYAAAKALIPQGLRTFTRSLMERRVDRRNIDVRDATKHLLAVQQPQVEEFEELCGRTFSCWRSVNFGRRGLAHAGVV